MPDEDEDEDEPVCAPPFQDIDVEKVILHPLFNITPGAPNDIALIRLAKEVTINRMFKIIKLSIEIF